MQSHPEDTQPLGSHFSPTGRSLLGPKASRVLAIACVAVVGGFEALALTGREWAHGPAIVAAAVCGVISPGWRGSAR